MPEYISVSEPGVYVPSAQDSRNVLTNSDLENMIQIDTSDDWITPRTGIKERRIEHYKDVREMGLEAANDLLFNKLGLNSEQLQEIDEILFATNSHAHGLEFRNHAGYVGGKLGIEDVALSDKGAGCTGLIAVMREAYNTLKVEKDKKKILVIGAEHLTSITDYFDRNTCILFGDAACAYLISRNQGDEEGIIKNVFGGKPDIGGEGWSEGYLTLSPKKGLRIRPLDYPGDESKFKFHTPKFKFEEREQNYLIMEGNKIFNYAVKVAMRRAIHSVLEGTPYTIADVDVIVPHGANRRITHADEEALRKKGFKGIIYTNLETHGNTSAASVGLAEEEARREKIIKRGQLILSVAFGAGLTWGANLRRTV